MKELVVGQKLYYVPFHSRSDQEEVLVTKIGRKWATIGEGWSSLKISLDTWIADGGRYSSPGRCYLSKKVYEEEQLRCQVWRDFIEWVQRRCLRIEDMPGLSADRIKAIRQELEGAEKCS